MKWFMLISLMMLDSLWAQTDSIPITGGECVQIRFPEIDATHYKNAEKFEFNMK